MRLDYLAALAVAAALAACGRDRPNPRTPEPIQPAPIIVRPDPLPCQLPPRPDPLGHSGATPMPAGRWALLDDAGARVIDAAGKPVEVVSERGVHVPRPWWDAYARYVAALQAITIDAKRCHPEPPSESAP